MGGRIGLESMAGPVEELAVRGVAQVVIRVAVGLVEGEGANHDGQRLEGLRRVGWATLAGNHALDVGFHGENDNEDKFAIAGCDANGIAEGE
jgi:hypothetical protein